MKTFSIAIQDLDDAFAALREVLLAEFELNVIQQSRKVSTPIVGIIAMGRWLIERESDEKEYDLKIIRTLNDVDSEYGANAIPGPIRIRCLDGKVVSCETDW